MLTLATWNTKKYQQIVAHFPSQLQVRQLDLDLPEIQTNILTDISYDKCLQAYVEVQWPVLVDDSGIYFDAFDQFPGALSKFLYQWVWLAWMRKLYEGEQNTGAVFQCVLSYMDSNLPEPIQFIGECEWKISFDRLDDLEENPKLPYDLIFIPAWMIEPAILHMDQRKDTNHHRVVAAKKFVERFDNK